MDAKARLVEMLYKAVEAGPRTDLCEFVADALLAEGVTLPEPSGPVTSEEAVIAYEVAYNSRRNGYLWFDPAWRIDGRHALDAAMPLLARDHGYIKLAEVERRAREWVHCRGEQLQAWLGSLLAALTAPEAK